MFSQCSLNCKKNSTLFTLFTCIFILSSHSYLHIQWGVLKLEMEDRNALEVFKDFASDFVENYYGRLKIYSVLNFLKTFF